MKRLLTAAGLAAPLFVFALVPLGVLLARGVASASVLDVVVQERAALSNTLFISVAAALFALGLGAPLSVLLFRTDLPFRRAFAALFVLPSAIPAFIWGMGWVALASPKAGLLNHLGASLDIYGKGGIAFVLGTSGLPLVLLAGAAAFPRIDPALEEAARVAGAGPLRALLSATLPLAWPSLVSGAVLVFLLAASAFAVPYMLGVAASPPTVVTTTRIYGEVLMGEGHVSRALALSAVLLLFAPAALALNALLGRSARVRLGTGKGLSPRPFALARARWPLAGAVFLAAGIVVLLPLAAIILTSLQEHFGAPLTRAGFGLTHWRAVLSSPRTWGAMGRSLALATAAGITVTAMGCALALSRRRLGRVGDGLSALAAFPYAIPGTVLAMALLVAFSRDLRFIAFNRVAFVLALANTPWLLLVAYSAKHLALGERQAAEGVAQLDVSLLEAARVAGSGPTRTFLDIGLPLLRPALTAAFVLTFLFCATEITMSVLLVPPGQDLLGTLLFELQTYADPAAASVLACALVLLAVVGQVSLTLASRRAPS